MAADRLSGDRLRTAIDQLRAAGCVFAEDEAALLLAAPGDLDALITRRVAGEPLEQVLGWAEFCGRRITLGPGVFVPRRRTEFLVSVAAGLLIGRSDFVALDLCCGSGALGAALVGSTSAQVELHAVDVDPAAVECARSNLPAGARTYLGDLFAPLPAGLRSRVDVLLANAPYVPGDEIEFLPAEARLFEPRFTLDGGGDGLDVHRRIAAGAVTWLVPGGSLLIETSERQRPTAAALLTEAGLRVTVATSDELDATVIVGTLD